MVNFAFHPSEYLQNKVLMKYWGHFNIPIKNCRREWSYDERNGSLHQHLCIWKDEFLVW